MALETGGGLILGPLDCALMSQMARWDEKLTCYLVFSRDHPVDRTLRPSPITPHPSPAPHLGTGPLELTFESTVCTPSQCADPCAQTRSRGSTVHPCLPLRRPLILGGNETSFIIARGACERSRSRTSRRRARWIGPRDDVREPSPASSRQTYRSRLTIGVFMGTGD